MLSKLKCNPNWNIIKSNISTKLKMSSKSKSKTRDRQWLLCLVLDLSWDISASDCSAKFKNSDKYKNVTSLLRNDYFLQSLLQDYKETLDKKQGKLSIFGQEGGDPQRWISYEGGRGAHDHNSMLNFYSIFIFTRSFPRGHHCSV